MSRHVVFAAARAPWRAPGRGPGPSARSSRAQGAPLGTCGKSLKTIEKTNANRKVLRNPDRGAWGQLLAAVRRTTASTGHPQAHMEHENTKNIGLGTFSLMLLQLKMGSYENFNH